eukprot:40676-Amphidinium_carterae.1
MATRYTPAVWMLVYQADVRMTLGNFERRRRAEVLKAAKGGKSPMSRSAPLEFWYSASDDLAEGARRAGHARTVPVRSIEECGYW